MIKRNHKREAVATHDGPGLIRPVKGVDAKHSNHPMSHAISAVHLAILTLTPGRLSDRALSFLCLAVTSVTKLLQLACYLPLD